MQVGRNDQCPCGSGKKYKKCCLPRDEERERASALHELDSQLMTTLWELAGRRWGPGWYGTVMTEAGFPASAVGSADTALFRVWVLFHGNIDGRAPAAHFQSEVSSTLSPDTVGWYKAQLDASLSVWEVEKVDPGVGMELRDLLSDARHSVLERVASFVVTPRASLMGRVTRYRGYSVLTGVHARPLPPQEAVKLLEATGGLGRPRTTMAETALLIRSWNDAVAALEARPAPQLTNMDGESVEPVYDRFEVVEGTPEEWLKRLADQPDTNFQDGQLTLTGEGRTQPGKWVWAHLEARDGAVVGHTNSVGRSQRLKSWIEAATAGALRHSGRTAPPTLGGNQEPAKLPELQRALQDYKKRYYLEQWIDSPVPALLGRTPRDAASDPEVRPRLELLLKDMEYMEGRVPEDKRFDMQLLRDALQLRA